MQSLFVVVCMHVGMCFVIVHTFVSVLCLSNACVGVDLFHLHECVRTVVRFICVSFTYMNCRKTVGADAAVCISAMFVSECVCVCECWFVCILCLHTCECIHACVCVHVVVVVAVRALSKKTA
eukprot:GDKI01014589.1.p2 GENE.GDKI01014589.1~~GDKI01014589.1.p2  ORF type:complete len:123 (-),score=29.32 GDKI01014589.1:215-583(-)